VAEKNATLCKRRTCGVATGGGKPNIPLVTSIGLGAFCCPDNYIWRSDLNYMQFDQTTLPNQSLASSMVRYEIEVQHHEKKNTLNQPKCVAMWIHLNIWSQWEVHKTWTICRQVKYQCVSQTSELTNNIICRTNAPLYKETKIQQGQRKKTRSMG
jgi:hypothetical protein